jgi:hypothetical protein
LLVLASNIPFNDGWKRKEGCFNVRKRDDYLLWRLYSWILHIWCNFLRFTRLNALLINKSPWFLCKLYKNQGRFLFVWKLCLQIIEVIEIEKNNKNCIIKSIL